MIALVKGQNVAAHTLLFTRCFNTFVFNTFVFNALHLTQTLDALIS